MGVLKIFTNWFFVFNFSTQIKIFKLFYSLACNCELDDNLNELMPPSGDYDVLAKASLRFWLIRAFTVRFGLAK